MKQILIALGLIVCVAQANEAERVQINETWEVGDSVYTMKTEDSYDESRVSIFKDINLNFHRADLLKTGGDKLEELLAIYKVALDSRATQFENGELSLLLLSKQDDISGGTYFKVEEDGKTVCIRGAGFKIDIPQQEKVLAYSKLVAALSSSKYFPESKRLVLFLKDGSQLIHLVNQLGFKDSDYPVTDITTLSQSLENVKLLSFEKAIMG